jgi:hypothetical protein
MQVTSRFASSAFAPIAPPIRRNERIGKFIGLSFLDNDREEVWLAQTESELRTNELGTLVIYGQGYMPLGASVTELMYRTVDNRFGEGTTGGVAGHCFGASLLPVLRRSPDGGIMLAGGDYQVRPEGIVG